MNWIGKIGASSPRKTPQASRLWRFVYLVCRFAFRIPRSLDKLALQRSNPDTAAACQPNLAQSSPSAFSCPTGDYCVGLETRQRSGASVLDSSCDTLNAQEDARVIGSVRIESTQPGELVVSWDPPASTPGDYRLSWARVGENFLTWTDSRGNAFPTSPSYTIRLSSVSSPCARRRFGRERLSTTNTIPTAYFVLLFKVPPWWCTGRYESPPQQYALLL